MVTLLHIGVLIGTIMLLEKRLAGFRVGRTSTAVITALVFSGLNWGLGWLVRPVLVAAMALPALFTLGLAFVFVPFLANTLFLWVTDKILGDFEIKSAKTLFVASAIITVVSGVFHWIVRH
jgi:uncharacterized membrane protein YvlD (DUF360 family)